MLNTVLLERTMPCKSLDKRFLLSISAETKDLQKLAWFKEVGEGLQQSIKAGQLFQPGLFGIDSPSKQVLVGYNSDNNKPSVRVLADGITLYCESDAVIVFDFRAFVLSALQTSQQGLDITPVMVRADGVLVDIDALLTWSWFSVNAFCIRRVPSSQPFTGLRFRYGANGNYAQLKIAPNGYVVVGSEHVPQLLTDYNKFLVEQQWPYLIGSGVQSSPIELFVPDSNFFRDTIVYRYLPTTAQQLFYKITPPEASTGGDPSHLSFLGHADTEYWEAYADEDYTELRAYQAGRVLALTNWQAGDTMFLKQVLDTDSTETSIVVRTGVDIDDLWDLTPLVKNFILVASLGPVGSGDGSQSSPYVLGIGDSGDINIDAIASGWYGPSDGVFHFGVDISSLPSSCQATVVAPDLATITQPNGPLRFELFSDGAFSSQIAATTGYDGDNITVNSGLYEGIGAAFTKPSSGVIYGTFRRRFNADPIFGSGRKARIVVEANGDPAQFVPGAVGTGVGSYQDPYVIALSDYTTVIDVDVIKPVGWRYESFFYCICDVSSLDINRYAYVFNYKDAQTTSPDTIFISARAGRFLSTSGGSSFNGDVGITTANGLFTTTSANPLFYVLRNNPSLYNNVLLIVLPATHGINQKWKIVVEQGRLI